MGKLTPNQIREQVRNEVAKRYTREIKELKDSVRYERQVRASFEKEYSRLQNEYYALLDEVEKLRDWNTRLQEFCNMTDEDREEAVNAFRAKIRAQQELANSPFLQFLRHFNF